MSLANMSHLPCSTKGYPFWKTCCWYWLLLKNTLAWRLWKNRILNFSFPIAVLALRYIGLGEGDANWSPWIIFIVAHCLSNFRVQSNFSPVFFHYLTRKTPYSCIFREVSEFTFELQAHLPIANTCGSWKKCPLQQGVGCIEVSR